MKKFILFLFILLASTSFLTAQSNEVIDAIINSEEPSFGNYSLLVLQATSKIDLDSTETDAQAFLAESKWYKKIPDAAKQITLGDAAFLILKSFDVKGGAGWSIFPSPRTAAREIAFKGAVYSNDKSPYRKISGLESMGLISWALELYQPDEEEQQ